MKIKTIKLCVTIFILSIAQSCISIPFAWDCDDPCEGKTVCVKDDSYPNFRCRWVDTLAVENESNLRTQIRKVVKEEENLECGKLKVFPQIKIKK